MLWSPDGTRIASAAFEEEGNFIQVYAPASRRLVSFGGARIVSSAFMKWSPDGTHLLSSGGAQPSARNWLSFWSVKNGRVQAVYAGHSAPVYDAAWLDRESIVTVDGEGGVHTWEAATGKAIARAQIPSRYLDQRGEETLIMQWSADGALLVLSCAGSRIRLWDRARQVVYFCENFDRRSEPTSYEQAALSPDGAQLAAASDEALTVWDVRKAAVIGQCFFS